MIPLRKRLFPVWIALVLLVMTGARAGAAEDEARRVALVVGNGAYRNAPALANPVNDAAAVANALRLAGFEVIQLSDVTREGLEDGIGRFLRVSSGAQLTLFYYSGHGIQAGGVNRIIPIDAKLENVADLDVETVSVDTLLRAMQQRSDVQLIFLDACRNNPFAGREFYVGTAKTRGVSGLAPVATTSFGALLGYSTEPGNVALDGDGSLSPYTSAFVRNVMAPGVELTSGLIKVRRDVIKATSGQQIPWESNSLTEAVYLMPEATASTALAEPLPADGSAVAALRSLLQSSPHVPVGIGPVKLFADAQTAPAFRNIVVQLIGKPRTGLLTLRGKSLSAGSQLLASELAEVMYEPQAGAEEQETSATWRIRADGEEGRLLKSAIRTAVDPCDTEAGEPLDPQGVTDGVVSTAMNLERAKAACGEAVAKYPDIVRFSYQLGRVQMAEGKSAEAFETFTNTARLGHIRSVFKLGYMASRGIGRKQDVAQSAELYKESAELGDPFGIYAYGLVLLNGRGVAADPARGISYIAQAADLGHISAFNQLGSLYYYGKGVPRDPARAIRYFQAGLSHQSVYSLNNLGLAYMEGVGVEQDYGRALELFKAASALGLPEAANNAGRMYFFGYGVPKSLDEAEVWYLIAAARGSRPASTNLGWIYLNGPAEKRDPVKAAQYYAQAAALDWFGRGEAAREALKSIDGTAKLAAFQKLMIALKGQAADVSGTDPDDLLVAMARQAWLVSNPRMDLF